MDVNDNCILVPNPNQANLDDDAQGDACDGDIDGDNVTNVAPIHYTNGTSQDLCPYVDASGNDENQDGCIDDKEPCEMCENPDKGNKSNTLLDPESIFQPVQEIITQIINNLLSTFGSATHVSCKDLANFFPCWHS